MIKYRCREADVDGVRLLLGMELCECSLHQLVSERGLRPTAQQQQRVVKQLCEGVAFLHRHSIIHRDLRPKNILLKQNDFDGTVKITDFGLSKYIDATDHDQSVSSSTTQAGSEVGSFGFYAPEVLRRQKQTSKVDIFSLGCCIFYLLTGGRRPHEDPSDRTNKYGLITNIYSSRSDLSALSHCPEAMHMVAHMIAGQKGLRPTAQWLLDWHCYFWSDRKRFEFLCAVGNEEERKAVLPASAAACRRVLGNRGSSARVRDGNSNGNGGDSDGAGNGAGWRALIDASVWKEYTSDSKYRQHYDPNSIPHLLRFMRNASQHTRPRSAASAQFRSAGGIERYFLRRFPRLLLVTWEAVVRAGWGRCKNSEFGVYLPSDPSNTQTTRLGTATPTGAGAGAGLGAGAGADAGRDEGLIFMAASDEHMPPQQEHKKKNNQQERERIMLKNIAKEYKLDYAELAKQHMVDGSPGSPR